MANRTFYCRFCAQGHLRYRLPPIDDERCQVCGSAWVLACPSCQTKLLSFFSSEVNWSDENEPVKKPQAPDHCASCGAALPWKPQRSKLQTEKTHPASLLGRLAMLFRGKPKP